MHDIKGETAKTNKQRTQYMHILERPTATVHQHVHMCEWPADTAQVFNTGHAVIVMSVSLPGQVLFESFWTQTVF